MENYTQLDCAFWTNPLVVAMSPNEKYFLLFLITNPKVLSNPKEVQYAEISRITGYNELAIDGIFDLFIRHEYLKYDNGVLRLRDEFNHFLKIGE